MNTLSKRELIEQLFNYLGESKCACHIIDCNKMRILMWKHKTLPNTYLLKIGDQLLISSLRTDKNGEIYWKYREFYEVEKTDKTSDENNNSPPESGAIEKFSQRQAKTEAINYERNSEPINSSSDRSGVE